MTPNTAVAAFCRSCTGVPMETRECSAGPQSRGYRCALHSHRLGRGRGTTKAIRRHCLSCMGGSRTAVKNCSTTGCLLFEYRFGTNPARRGVGRPQNFENRAEISKSTGQRGKK